MVRLVLFLIIISTVGCGDKCLDFCKPVVLYERYEVPVYTNVLDNVTLDRPKLKYFEFSEKGSVSLDEDNFKLMLENLINLNTYANSCEAILGER